MTLAIILGLAFGKPLGFALASGLAVMFGLAVNRKGFVAAGLRGRRADGNRPYDVFVYCDQALPVAADFETAKITVFIASRLSAVIGVALLWIAGLAPRKATNPAVTFG